MANAIGSVKKPNTAFKNETESSPMNRWRSLIDGKLIAEMEGLIGDELKSAGYSLSTTIKNNNRYKLIRLLFGTLRDIRFWTKFYTPLHAFGETPYHFNRKHKKK